MDLTHWEQKQFVFLYVLGLCWHLLIWFCVSLSVNKEIQTQWSLRIGSALSLCAYIKLKTILIFCPKQLPDMGMGPLLQFPHSPRAGPVYFFPTTFFILPRFGWFCIFFSSGQVFLPAVSWCSARSPVSEGVFLIYLWREMYSTSTYSSATFRLLKNHSNISKVPNIWNTLNICWNINELISKAFVFSILLILTWFWWRAISFAISVFIFKYI